VRANATDEPSPPHTSPSPHSEFQAMLEVEYQTVAETEQEEEVDQVETKGVEIAFKSWVSLHVDGREKAETRKEVRAIFCQCYQME